MVDGKNPSPDGSAKIFSIMSMPLETFMPCLATVDASVAPREIPVGQRCSGSSINNPRIISPGSGYAVDFSWTAGGNLFQLIGPGQNWLLEVFLENVGAGANDNNAAPGVANVPHVPGQAAYAGTVSFNALEKGRIYKPVVKLSLIVNNVLVVCGFDELSTIHVSE